MIAPPLSRISARPCAPWIGVDEGDVRLMGLAQQSRIDIQEPRWIGGQ